MSCVFIILCMYRLSFLHNPFFTPGLLIRVDDFLNPELDDGGFATNKPCCINEFGLVPLDITFIGNVVDGDLENDAAEAVVTTFLKSMNHFCYQPNQFPP